jgi:hypothetical protein
MIGRSSEESRRPRVRFLVTRYARMARGDRAGLRYKRIGSHTIRHNATTPSAMDYRTSPIELCPLLG